MIENVRLALRITDNVFDTEIQNLIAACIEDLKPAGIAYDENYPLMQQAIILYAKGHFGYADAGERYLAVYESLKTPLRLTRKLYV